MADANTPRRVAIFNSRPDFIAALTEALEADGVKTASAHLADIQSGALDLIAFVHLHKPDLVVYDLPRPFERHWNFLQLLRETKSLKDVTWVLATTDREALEAAVGASEVVQIIFGEPYGVPEVVAAIHKKFLATAKGSINFELRSVHVLVVDDSRVSLDLLSVTLESYGATVTTVSTAEHALDLLQQLRPDVLISDLEMPDKDGYWLIGQVRALGPDQGGLTPAACLTGRGDPETRARVLRAGFQYHIVKPISTSRLVGIVGILALKP